MITVYNASKLTRLKMKAVRGDPILCKRCRQFFLRFGSFSSYYWQKHNQTYNQYNEPFNRTRK